MSNKYTPIFLLFVLLFSLISGGCAANQADSEPAAQPANNSVPETVPEVASSNTNTASPDTAVPDTSAPDSSTLNASPPNSPVKLIFIHHSTGGNWLADPNEDGPYGGLGQALMENNYYVSATNYGWGPDGIGDRTDIVNWPEWFTGPNSDEIMTAVYNETGQNFGDFGAWSHLSSDPGGENEIILFKSCFPNSDLYGSPNDPAYPTPNDWEYSVSNAKAVYNQILTYFAAHQDKLFVVITAPALAEGEYTMNDHETPAADRAANARAFNNWLLNDWLDGYAYANVAVFDYYNVLTSNGSNGRTDDPTTSDEPNDIGFADGNHHRWTGSAIEHIQTIATNYSAYPSYSEGADDWYDSHPTTAGHQKATAEFIPLLNIYYHHWQESSN
ncbi:MAG: hypothetical protein KC415_23345 [Anaerolineales bacterium]|nr:hypothetical protein [Anaerolineales bacterium]MCB8991682.1 hypothetical protein [Ardenticatenaceae bacterium]MCB9005554.1 hypothetical protein [Ardenticatenaceae bacterium]